MDGALILPAITDVAYICKCQFNADVNPNAIVNAHLITRTTVDNGIDTDPASAENQLCAL